MKIFSNSFNNGETIPSRYCFARIDPDTHVTLAENLNPHLIWSEFPEGTKSFALICHDPDAPSVADDANQEGRTIPASLPRADFYHWVLFNIPASVTEITEGSQCSSVTAKGKAGPDAPGGMSHGINSYTQWFAGDADMEGSYFGYDGPCPPWNDEIPHHYVFSIYALDVESIDAQPGVDGETLYEELEIHILDGAAITGTYTLNPSVA
ncbi:YbhB/YbcL family Raf kinase inhibitor-like protein [Marinobacterium lutimaris]|uniref:Phospholipid-binding protein, PBP family n=1 Tax=Marinobacterium lutimaris TaxID=568106 RepID=A0A1H6C098_9GAMM|nr:YbhB/YbcL family Raf kinase inhibitor-like protein [Marinobacterium lutimaris]SEG66370.1 hypothetical protein SAMN05444390_10355 [Marinobacterium lutimaris]